MSHVSKTRLDTTHTWEELAAFVRAVPAPLSAIMEFGSAGRMRIHYVTRKGAIAAQAVCTLSKGWPYGLPAGTPGGVEAAGQAGAGWNG